ncbi:zinc finger A20 and AN1 domain-containing stress-associated protein [Trifolium repens]|nr:zinc finger A20 and AN1 domain-containing stress-associated protein [Trifolium repens]
MAEEQPCQAPEGHRLCANNCGFLGSPATMNLCSKCYGDIRIKEQQDASTKSTIENALSSSSSSSSAVASVAPPSISISEPIVVSVESINPTPALTEIASSSITVDSVGSVQPNRYPERHGCSFDFKTVGREEIARANPLIRAEKLQRI